MERKMTRRTRWAGRFLLLVFTLSLAMSMAVPAMAAEGPDLEMSTAYPGVTAKAGDSLGFDLDFSNGSGAGADLALTVTDIPDGWDGYFQGGSSQISHVFVRSGDWESLASFQLTIPVEAAEGTYTVGLRASGDGLSSDLTLTLDVSEEELGSSSLTTEYPEQEGSSGTTFSFTSTIQNNTPSEQSYSLAANAPSGWVVAFKPSGESTQVASLTVPARSSQGMSIEITPPNNVEAGEYSIPISAISASETLDGELTVTVSGSYSLDLSTPSGLLSFDAAANKQSAVTLSVTNTGNVDLQNVNLTSSAATGWTVEYSESSIDVLEAGATHEVTAYVTPSDEAMSGDYVVILTASNSETSDQAEFRVSVKTETVWGVVGVALILVIAVALWFIFRKFGRR